MLVDSSCSVTQLVSQKHTKLEVFFKINLSFIDF